MSLEICQYFSICGLKSLPQNIHNRPLDGVKAANLGNGVEAGGKVLPYKFVNFLKGVVVEGNDSLQRHVGAQHIEEQVQAFILVELCELAADFIIGGEIGGSIGEPRHHLPEVGLEGGHFLLQILVLLLQLVLLLLDAGELGHD